MRPPNSSDSARKTSISAARWHAQTDSNSALSTDPIADASGTKNWPIQAMTGGFDGVARTSAAGQARGSARNVSYIVTVCAPNQAWSQGHTAWSSATQIRQGQRIATGNHHRVSCFARASTAVSLPATAVVGWAHVPCPRHEPRICFRRDHGQPWQDYWLLRKKADSSN